LHSFLHRGGKQGRKNEIGPNEKVRGPREKGRETSGFRREYGAVATKMGRK